MAGVLAHDCDGRFLPRTAGNKLGLLDEQDLKFATSQVLRKGPRAGADAVCTQFAGNRRSRRAPTSGESITQMLSGSSVAFSR